MRKVLFIPLLFLLCYCSSSDNDSQAPVIVPTSTNKMNVGSTNYNLDHAYIRRFQDNTTTFYLTLSNGETYFDGNHAVTGYSPSHTHGITFALSYPVTENPPSIYTYRFGSFPGLSATGFGENGVLIFNESSIIDHQASVVFSYIPATSNGTVTFNYLTTLGSVHGTFKGLIQKEY